MNPLHHNAVCVSGATRTPADIDDVGNQTVRFNRLLKGDQFHYLKTARFSDAQMKHLCDLLTIYSVAVLDRLAFLVEARTPDDLQHVVDRYIGEYPDTATAAHSLVASRSELSDLLIPFVQWGDVWTYLLEAEYLIVDSEDKPGRVLLFDRKKREDL